MLVKHIVPVKTNNKNNNINNRSKKERKEERKKGGSARAGALSRDIYKIRILGVVNTTRTVVRK